MFFLHIDDKFGVNVDDIHQMEGILAPELKAKYRIQLINESGLKDEIHLRYFKQNSF